MYEYYSHDFTNGAALRDNEIFVFGSNLAGYHGRGAAKTALLYFGAVYGVGQRFTGKCYAIPTKDHKIKTLPLEGIAIYVDSFISIAALFPERVFIVTKIGCGLAGYKDHEIAPLFKGAPSNCKFHIDWKIYLGEDYESF
jgi:hypothetical protein